MKRLWAKRAPLYDSQSGDTTAAVFFLTIIILFANRVQNECKVKHYQYYECNNNTVILLFNRLESYWFGDASAHHAHRLVPDTHSWRFAL